MSTYVLGNVVHLERTVEVDGNLTDAATITVTIQKPDGTLTTPATPTRDSLGTYHYDYTPAAAGRYVYRWVTTGPVAAAEGDFEVTDDYAGGRDGLDVLSLPEARLLLHKANPDTATSKDEELAVCVAAISRRFDQLCGPIVTRTVTNEAHDGGEAMIVPLYRPVYSISSLVEWSAGASTTLTAESVSASGDYLLDPEISWIYRRSGWSDSTFLSGRRNILLTYVAGRYTSTAAVAAHFKTAARITLQHIWRPTQPPYAQAADPMREVLAAGEEGIPPWLIPRAALHLLSDELRGPAVA